MRFVVTALITAILLGSVAWSQYVLTRGVQFDVTRDAHTHGDAVAADADAAYRLVLTPAFDAVRDPFALQIDDTAPAPRLLVRSGDRELLAWTADVRRGEPVRVEDLALAGEHTELFVQATPSPAEAARPCALRVQLWGTDDTLLDEATLWSEGGGARISGALTLSLRPRLQTLDRGLGEGAP